MTDCELIEQLRSGKLEALGELYDRHHRMVYRAALGITGDSYAADDLVQEVFLRLHRFAHHVDVARPLEPWLYRMTTNQAYTWLRRHNRWTRSLEDVAEWLTGSKKHSPVHQYEEDEEWRSVQQAISDLPFAHRVVVALYYLNDLSLQEISEIVEAPVGTVKSRLHYGRQALKERLGQAPDRVPEMRYEFT